MKPERGHGVFETGAEGIRASTGSARSFRRLRSAAEQAGRSRGGAHPLSMHWVIKSVKEMLVGTQNNNRSCSHFYQQELVPLPSRRAPFFSSRFLFLSSLHASSLLQAPLVGACWAQEDQCDGCDSVTQEATCSASNLPSRLVLWRLREKISSKDFEERDQCKAPCERRDARRECRAPQAKSRVLGGR